MPKALIFELVVQTASGDCAISLHEQEGCRQIMVEDASKGRITLVVVSQDDLSVHGRVRVGAPNQIVSVRAIRSAVEPEWTSEFVRPVEFPDILENDSQGKIRLAGGWAPRELMDGSPLRWVGSDADFEFDPAASSSKLKIAGVAGPCLGRDASVTFFSGREHIKTLPLDVEDGQRFKLQIRLKNLAFPGRLAMKVNRPQPRFTSHDVRVLNLLVKEVTLR